jgi:oligoribonuclease
MNKANILWVDLEMTGLSPENDRIVEVGAIATDWNFREIARYESAVKVPQDFLESRLVGKFWDANDFSRKSLIAQNKKAQKSVAEVDAELVKFCEKYFAKIGNLSVAEQKKFAKKNGSFSLADLAPIYLAGNSIHQDQKFIEREFPALQKLLHYRQLDVSSWKIVMENRGQIFAKKEDHRAMADIEGSIAELKFYLNKLNFAKKSAPKIRENPTGTASETPQNPIDPFREKIHEKLGEN